MNFVHTRDGKTLLLARWDKIMKNFLSFAISGRLAAAKLWFSNFRDPIQ